MKSFFLFYYGIIFFLKNFLIDNQELIFLLLIDVHPNHLIDDW